MDHDFVVNETVFQEKLRNRPANVSVMRPVAVLAGNRHRDRDLRLSRFRRFYDAPVYPVFTISAASFSRAPALDSFRTDFPEK